MGLGGGRGARAGWTLTRSRVDSLLWLCPPGERDARQEQVGILAHLLVVAAARAVPAPARPPEQPVRQRRGSAAILVRRRQLARPEAEQLVQLVHQNPGYVGDRAG